MNEESRQKWAQSLQQKHLRGVALTILEGAGPMKLFLSQVMLSTAPFFGGSNRATWQAIAEMLEDEKESREFAQILREETIQ
jgi:hypothetical protein